jgi:hypothetical protein
MENVLGDVLGSTTEAPQTEVTTNEDTSELGSEYDLDLSELEDQEEANEDENENEGEDENDDSEALNPTNQAFAKMRVQTKEQALKLKELDEIAKKAGLKDVDELIAKSKEAQIKAEAKSKGISEDMARELAEFREFKEQYKKDQAEAAYKAKEMTLVSNIKDFIADNSLSKDAVNKLSNDLEKDGITNQYLMDLPKSALNRILGSYIGTNVQKNLERKEAIKKELPLNQTSKVDTEGINKQIDDLAKIWAGKN